MTKTTSAPNNIAMVINLDIHAAGMRRYVKRLNFTRGLAITLFIRGEGDDDDKYESDTEVGDDMVPAPSRESAGELVDVLRAYGQRVPRELLALAPPPPLMDPPWQPTPPMAAAAVATVIADIDRDDDNGNNNDNNGRTNGNDDALGRMGGNHAQRRRYHQNYRRRRDPSGSNTSLDDEENEDDDDLSPMEGPTSATVRRLQRQRRRGGGEGPILPQDNDDGGLPPDICRPVAGGREGMDVPYVRSGPVRRIRHSEVVLVDQALRAYGRTWLRLRWPGDQGGFGGFVALSNVDHDDNDNEYSQGHDGVVIWVKKGEDDGEDAAVSHRGSTNKMPHPPRTTSASAAATQTALLCQETNVNYPTSDSMRLLPLYDDGLLKGGQGVGEDGMMIGETLLMGSLVEVDHGEVSVERERERYGTFACIVDQWNGLFLLVFCYVPTFKSTYLVIIIIPN
jgi:hypothetical protein